MLWEWRVGDVEDDFLGAEVLGATKRDRESDLPQMPRDVPVQTLEHTGVLQARERDLQSGQDLCRQQIEAGACVDQHLGDLEVVDDGRHDPLSSYKLQHQIKKEGVTTGMSLGADGLLPSA